MARPDGLPEPLTVGDLYLAAILDELRAARGSRPEQSGSDVRVKEQKKRG